MENKEHNMVPLDSLRSKLGKMTERIIFRLEDRSGFPFNPPEYEPGAITIVGKSNTSFLEFAIQGMEEYHVSLGRYEYPDQFPIMRSLPPPTMARRLVGIPALPYVGINLKDKLLPFYRDIVLPQLCELKDDPDTYGETVYLDADVLELLNERINVGRYVARAKVEEDPSIWDIVSDSGELIKKLRDHNQEERIIGSVNLAADKYGLRRDLAGVVFRWVIEQTIGVEVAYLQGIPRPNIK